MQTESVQLSSARRDTLSGMFYHPRAPGAARSTASAAAASTNLRSPMHSPTAALSPVASASTMAARLASPSSGSRRLSLTINGVAPLAAAAHKPSVSAVPLFYDRPCSPEANRLVNVPRMPSMDRATSPQRRASVSAPPVDDIPIADCILLLHGLMSDKREPVLAALAMALSEHYTCFMFDFPGQGGSEGEFEYGGYQNCVDDVDHVVRWLMSSYRLRVVCIIGHSMGGNVALLYAAQHQQRLQAAAAAAAIAAPVQSPSHHPSSNRPQSPRGGGARYMTSSALANAAIAATFAGGAAARAQSPTARRPVSMYTTASQSATQAVATNFAAVKSPVHSHKEVQAPVPLIVNLSARFHLNQGLIEPHQVGDIKSFYDDPRQSFVLQHKGRPYLIKRKSVADRLRVDMKSCANIPPTVKILTVHGDADEVVPFSDSGDLHMLLTASVSQRPTPSYSIQAAGAAAVAAAASAAARHTLVAVRGADHAYSKPEQLANAVEQVLEWLVPNLQAREGKATSQSRFTFGM